MMYPYMTLNDDTEITHSEMRGDRTVKVNIETPDERDVFHNAVCILPQYEWKDIHVHVAEGKATANATKIWITSSGKAIFDSLNARKRRKYAETSHLFLGKNVAIYYYFFLDFRMTFFMFRSVRIS